MNFTSGLSYKREKAESSQVIKNNNLMRLFSLSSEFSFDYKTDNFYATETVLGLKHNSRV